VNTPIPVRRVCVLLLFSAIVAPSLFARVGETQDVVERRILQPNLGKMYFKAKPSADQREERERQKEEREQPFNDARKFFPADSREGVYWKSAVAGQLSSDNGWKVHVFYAGGRSMLEAYRRVGEGLNEFEVRALLAVNRGNSSWKKISVEGGGTKGIGYDYELEDGSMRAKQKGDWLMIFSTRLDTYVVEQQKIAKDIRDRETDQLKLQQQGKAPESVQGL
jgi:Fe-S cluster assembly iron-binding protein IscA